MSTDNVTEMKRFLNILASLSPRTSPYTPLDPAKIELAIVRFCALQIYLVEGLGLLDKFVCTAVTIGANLEDDGYLQGSATISGSASGAPLSFQTGLFTYRAVDAKGNKAGNYATAPCGELVLITHTNYRTTVNCDVTTTADGRKLLKVKAYTPQNPPDNRPPDDDTQQA